MANELPIQTQWGETRVFLQDGFYNKTICGHFHKHYYAELHFFLGGNAVFAIDDKRLEIKSGTMLVIPPGTIHTSIQMDEAVCHKALQIDLPVSEFSVCLLDENILEAFLSEIKNCSKTDDYTLISSFIALFCGYFYKPCKIKAKRVNNYEFIMYEFFSTRFHEDIHLCDLAKELHVSERQAERIVIKYTGRTFRKMLADTRIEMARLLLGTFDTLQKVSEQVGYRSYAGFWKAFRKYDS